MYFVDGMNEARYLAHAVDRFKKNIETDVAFQQARGIVESNAQGRVWLIGGTVYRSLSAILSGSVPKRTDFDFLVESANAEIQLPEGWSNEKNRFGNPKFVSEEGSIDMVPLGNVISIYSRGLDPTVENFLSGTPLDVQSLAYDLRSKTIIGELGLRAVLSGTVGINDFEMAEESASRKSLSVREYLDQKAEYIGFIPKTSESDLRPHLYDKGISRRAR